MNIAINGFGRIGRQILRIIQENHADDDLNVVLINDLTDAETLAHLFEFDSTYGHFDCGGACFRDGMLTTKFGKIRCTAHEDPATLPYKELKVDIALECTGHFRKREDAALHLQAGAKKVIISAPCKSKADGTFCLGVNEDLYDPSSMHVLSNASCTTNSLAPIVKVLHDAFGIERGLMTTIHSYTNDQRILDFPHKDWRRARSAAENIIPTTTGAAEAVGLVIPELNGKLNGIAVRIPSPTVSVTDFVAILNTSTDIEKVHAAFRKAEAGRMKGILGVEDRPLVSMDYRGDPRSSIVDALSTQILDGNFVKILAWYDNEWGYSNRMVDLTKYVGERL
ncbi:type I glyceraldehyde-3-phosphate dehydrogenase [Candidatus Peregrinibacteria bacterium CG10_big_fil_rev_8_21_14_0_10_49_16]|nr:MAG: type I glyceraldehyde-3-phosphate dehydrogenase [Candidatus Peregrinibacteria bacterium CG22_combo_CG10-13_8_21_14_all_49_11]PIR52274.1 MAG: type I glyceraldehyde-3-phosphate dehydrogenase [Candidatus Peregrinibacteria bacterium CG10_big_fil_rev_8_21_14_0_10_49_16]